MHRVFMCMEMAQVGVLPRQDLDGEKTPFQEAHQVGEAGMQKMEQYLQEQTETRIGSA